MRRKTPKQKKVIKELNGAFVGFSHRQHRFSKKKRYKRVLKEKLLTKDFICLKKEIE